MKSLLEQISLLSLMNLVSSMLFLISASPVVGIYFINKRLDSIVVFIPLSDTAISIVIHFTEFVVNYKNTA